MSSAALQARLLGPDDHSQPKEREEWDFSSKETLSATHGIHTYVAAMNPHLARELLARLTKEGDHVFDPFAGGGAVPVETILAKRRNSGIDVNELAVLVSTAKTTHVPRNALESAYAAIIRRLPTCRAEPPEFPKGMKIDFWFKPDVISELAKLKSLVEEVEDAAVRRVMQVALSATVRDVSLTYRGEVRLRRLQGADYGKFNPDVRAKFMDRAQTAIERVSGLPRHASAGIRKGTILKSGFDDCEFQAIICSPPYADDRNGVGYFQFSKNMLFWLGFTEEHLKDDRSNFLGHTAGTKTAPESTTLSEALAGIERNPIPSNPRATQECTAFYHDYNKALQEMTRVCNGPIAIVIGDRRLSQVFIDNARITTDLMASHGFGLDRYYYRTIVKKRIPVMKGGNGQRDRSGGGLIDREHTLIYRPGPASRTTSIG